MNTQVRYHQRRLADVAAALRLSRTQTSREQGPRAQLAQHQQQRLETVVRHAATHGGIDPPGRALLRTVTLEVVGVGDFLGCLGMQARRRK